MPQSPDFSREAGLTLASPYFTDPPRHAHGQALADWFNARRAEKQALAAACEKADDYDGLPADMKAVYDKAAEAVSNAMAQQTPYDRLHGVE